MVTSLPIALSRGPACVWPAKCHPITVTVTAASTATTAIGGRSRSATSWVRRAVFHDVTRPG